MWRKCQGLRGVTGVAYRLRVCGRRTAVECAPWRSRSSSLSSARSAAASSGRVETDVVLGYLPAAVKRALNHSDSCLLFLLKRLDPELSDVKRMPVRALSNPLAPIRRMRAATLPGFHHSAVCAFAESSISPSRLASLNPLSTVDSSGVLVFVIFGIDVECDGLTRFKRGGRPPRRPHG